MSANVLPFPPVVSRPVKAETPMRPCVVGDLVLVCVNSTLGLWVAFPVAVVDDDGVVLGVHTPPDNRLIGVDRMSCDPSCFGFAAADHEAEPFEAMRWKTWRDVGEALMAFAAVGVARP